MKQLLTTLAIIAISSVLFISCSNTANESGTNTATSGESKSSFDLGAARKAIDSINNVFSSLAKKGDSVGLAALYTSDGKMMPANMPAATGQKEITSAFAGLIHTMGPIDLAFTTINVWGADPLAIEEGTVRISKDGKEMDRGKYIVIWKMEDGKWKLFRDIFNSDLPPMAPPK